MYLNLKLIIKQMKRGFLFVYIVVFAIIMGCSRQTQNNSLLESNQENTITISDFSFQPQEIMTNAGTEIIWKQDDSVKHTVVSNGMFESKILSNGDKFMFKFDKPGTYEYYCSIHPSMKGKVIVKQHV